MLPNIAVPYRLFKEATSVVDGSILLEPFFSRFLSQFFVPKTCADY